MELAGHPTAVHDELKNGDTTDDETKPEKPALHAQPKGTLAPLLNGGQDTAVQEIVKNGKVVVAVTLPA